MDLNAFTICACVSCGYPVVGAHDCDRQLAENPSEPMSNLERVVFMSARGELIAQMALARTRK